MGTKPWECGGDEYLSEVDREGLQEFQRKVDGTDEAEWREVHADSETDYKVCYLYLPSSFLQPHTQWAHLRPPHEQAVPTGMHVLCSERHVTRRQDLSSLPGCLP